MHALASQLELHRLNTGMQPRVVTAVTLLKRMLFRYQGHVSAALVLGGCDVNGPHLYHIYPHGSTGKLPYVTMGSGSLAAMSVFEAGWKEGMTEAEAIELVQNHERIALRTVHFNHAELAHTNIYPEFAQVSFMTQYSWRKL